MSNEGNSLYEQGYEDGLNGVELSEMDVISLDHEYLKGYALGKAEKEQRRAGGWPAGFFWRRVGEIASELGLNPADFSGIVPSEYWDDFMEGFQQSDE